ncbi:prephenate dehydrogenase [Echinicola vietnamensis]|uniref:Prephenate dehydrogenase n=1 Tax=Echinicola vietnamensis (strain DSM 17526 / LMG 23754 / KMM 6221) TaxID=926556 RepID=L0FSZ8_ECHVK|nr:prephenate dehydrogenase [Echinicola vietnamensis]AGA76422.1 prephenate dehydrogenase [Echinicola vietnamensis DSM 17526]
MKQIHIIGLGLLGGSFSLGLKKALTGLSVSGFDLNKGHLQEALSLGIIDRVSETVPADTDLVIVATPVDTISGIVSRLLDHIPPETLVVDFGSTKEHICSSVSGHAHRQNFLAAHPIAGTEYAGPSAAFPDLLKGKIMILCETDKTGPDLCKKAYRAFEALEMQIRIMGPHEHDNQLAFVSHLSHISSFMLGKTVLDKMEDDKHILNMAGSGFASTVRLAKSSPSMWTPIMKENKENILEALNGYIENLASFRDHLVNDQYEELSKNMKNANQIGQILNFKS